MTIAEFVARYGLKPNHICNRDIVSLICLGAIFVNGKTKSSNEFGVLVYPPPGQRHPEHAGVHKALAAGLQLLEVRPTGTYVYQFDPANEEQARTAIEIAGMNRGSSPDLEVPL